MVLIVTLPWSAVAADLRCNACGGAIAGPYAQTDRGFFHPEHFLCEACKKPISGRYFEAGSAVLCEDCRTKRLPVCAVCQKPIESEGVETDLGIYHLQHFTCAGCGQALQGAKYIEQDKKPWCRACFENRFCPRCAVCGTPMTEEGLKDSWGSVFCARHADELPRCGSCGRLVCQSLTGGGETYPDGRIACGICLRTAVRDPNHAQRLFAQTADALSRLGLIDLNAEPIPLKLVGRAELGGDEKDPTLWMKGRTQIHSESRGRTTSYKVLEIRILYGLPTEEFSTVAAHELMHADLAEDGITDLPKTAEEGLCELGSWLWLERRPGDFAAYLRTKKEKNEDPVYGDGFRAASDAYKKMGMGELLKFVKQRKKLP